MSDFVPKPILEEDSIDLAALRFVLIEAKLAIRETCQADLPRDVQDAQDRNADERSRRAAGDIAARDCLKFNGESAAASEYRSAKHRHYSMYALHPDTAEQVIKALEVLMDSVGPRFRIPTRSRHYTARTVRNSSAPVDEG